jgi:glycine/D-amino acid oxidase-like deaminating enzyme
MRVIVLGAGVVGAAVAARIAGRGHEVLVLEVGPAPASGTSGTSYAWVNGNSKRPEHYRTLNAAAIAEHHRLGGVERGWLVPNGHLEYADSDDHRDRLTERVTRLSEAGYPASFLSAEAAAALEPDLRVLPDALVGWFPGEAHCYPELFVAALLGTPGITVATGRAAMSASDTGVELADGATLRADRVVTCVGRHTATLHPDVPMASGTAVIGVLARTEPVPVRLSRPVTTDTVNLRPAGGGALLAHALDQDPLGTPDAPVPAPVLATLRARIAERVGYPVTLTSTVVGLRALPADGLPVVGPLAGRGYVVVTHSGITLAPLLGELVAREVCDAAEQPLLAPYRVERFQQSYRPVEPARHPGEQ